MARRITALTLVLLVVLGGWLAFRAYQLQRELGAARRTLQGLGATLTSDDQGKLERDLAEARQHVSVAGSAVNDPVWRLASAVPVAGRSFLVARRGTAAVRSVLTDVVPPARQAADLVRARPLLAGGVVDVGRVAALEPKVADALRASESVQREVQATGTRWLPRRVADQQRQLERRVDELVSGLRAVTAAVRVAPGMLGAQGARRYFVAVQNNAEARGTGGIIGAYAILRADHGRIIRERVGTDRDLVEQPAPLVDLGPEYAEQYDRQSGRTVWTAAVITPNWPSAAQVVASLWSGQGGGRIDGVIGVDPLAMAQILGATGDPRHRQLDESDPRFRPVGCAGAPAGVLGACAGAVGVRTAAGER
ncbi:MAG: DUF4012 domain-containing protein [Actinobacteria bacterium]|nr:DUF4012 domain-containing protein [Actinomycetota bacterium]